MGDPRKLTRKYETPRKIWETERIETESKLINEYGLKNTSELWIIQAELKKARHEARRLLSIGDEASAEESKKILNKLARLGIGKEIDTLDKVLTLSARDFLERRLQTRVQKLGLARTTKQARQIITHGYVSIGGRKVTSPSYVVPVALDGTIAYYKKIALDLTPKTGGKKGGARRPEGAPSSAPAAAAPAAAIAPEAKAE